MGSQLELEPQSWSCPFFLGSGQKGRLRIHNTAYGMQVDITWRILIHFPAQGPLAGDDRHQVPYEVILDALSDRLANDLHVGVSFDACSGCLANDLHVGVSFDACSDCLAYDLHDGFSFYACSGCLANDRHDGVSFDACSGCLANDLHDSVSFDACSGFLANDLQVGFSSMADPYHFDTDLDPGC